MTNKPNTDKTIEQIRDELVDQYAKDVATDSERFFMTLAYVRGFDAAIHLCEQRERDLVEILGALDIATDLMSVPEQHQDDEWYRKSELVVRVFQKHNDALKKHRGVSNENE